MPNTVLGSGDNVVNKTRHGLCQNEDHSTVIETDCVKMLIFKQKNSKNGNGAGEASIE